jgi:glutamyl-tRNA reductase
VEIILLGLNHKTAPVDVRERVATAETEAPSILRGLVERPYLAEAVLLSTCNRVEIYAGAKSAHAGLSELRRFLAERAGKRETDLAGLIYERRGEEATRHAFRVASSLDSMMLGEPQILGQVKDAFTWANDAKTVGPLLNRLFTKTFQVAKRVRTETGIAKNAVSLSYAAVEIARKVFSDLSKKVILLVGAGKMAELSLKHLTQAGVGEVIVANRSEARAQELAARLGGRARSLADLDLLLERADVVVSSTAAPGYVITARDMEQAMRRRRGRPVVLVDLAVPRDIDPAADMLDGVYLFNVDNLEEVVANNLAERQREAQLAERLIEGEVVQFQSWLKSLDIVPTVTSLRKKVQGIAQAEYEKILPSLAHLGDKDRALIERAINGIVNKILHEPSDRLKRPSEDPARLAEVARYLFNLSAAEEEAEPASNTAPAPKKAEAGK